MFPHIYWCFFSIAGAFSQDECARGEVIRSRRILQNFNQNFQDLISQDIHPPWEANVAVTSPLSRLEYLSPELHVSLLPLEILHRDSSAVFPTP